jgi:hypothetical protein
MSNAPTQIARMERWRHKTRGHVYEVLTHKACLQCSAAPDIEATFWNDNWTVYRNVNTGAVWVRPTEEFLDDQFERVPDE